MQVIEEVSDSYKNNDNVNVIEGVATDTVTCSTTEVLDSARDEVRMADSKTATAVLKLQTSVVPVLNELTSYVSDTRTEISDKSSSDAFYLTELRKSVDSLVKVQYALVTLSCFVCLCLFALVIVLSLAFL